MSLKYKLALMALLSTLPPINPRLNGGPAIMPDFYHRGGGGFPNHNAMLSARPSSHIFRSFYKGPLLTGGVPLIEHGMAESKFRIVLHIFYDKCDTLLNLYIAPAFN